MEKELDLILQEFDEGNMCLDTLKTKLLLLFSVMPRSYGIVRWFDNVKEDVVCVDKTTAEDYVRKYNELSSEEKCYVDEEIWLPLNKA